MRLTLPDNHRPARPESESLGRSHPEERVEVTLKLRRRTPLPAAGEVLGHDDFAAAHGATTGDMTAVLEFAGTYAMAVVDASAAERRVVLSGSVLAMEAAFGVELHQYAHADVGVYRGHPGPVSIPAALGGVVECVLGLDERPQAKPHFRRGRGHDHFWAHGAIAEARGDASPAHPPGTFTPPQLARLYDFPAGVTGAGRCIAIVELGGGYRPADLRAYFAGLGVPMPQVAAIGVDGGRNLPTGSPDGPDGEVMLDIEVAGAVAPGARIAVYFAANTDRGFLDAASKAIHDRVNKPVAVSISWGGPEAGWTGAAMRQFDAVLAEAAALGVTVAVASGDDGSSDGVADGHTHVDFPASSPHVLACGGTRLIAGAAGIASEVVWNDGPGGGASGGGYSGTFPVPAWQVADRPPPVHVRGVPDVAANADPVTGYVVRVDGQDMVIGGTSAVAPLYAGLIALIAEANGPRPGFVNPRIYAAPHAFRDVTSGSNGAYSAGPSWDACTGLGSPIGTRLLAALSTAAG